MHPCEQGVLRQGGQYQEGPPAVPRISLAFHHGTRLELAHRRSGTESILFRPTPIANARM
jgi:hypothetical protein